MPKYTRTCLYCQKEFTSVYVDRCFCCSRSCSDKYNGLRRAKPLAERYRAKVDKGGENGCWKWLGSKDSNGYGRINSGLKSRDNLSAHRVSYELHYGPIPTGAVVMHSCDNPECTNPAHLSIGTVKDNAQDMIRKGRGNKAYGARQAKAKFKDEDVIAIKQLIGQGIPCNKIARMYNVSKQCILAIAWGKTWKHLLLPK